MYLYPMGNDDEAINPKSLYKSAEVIDVESEEYEDNKTKELFDSNHQYKRITRQWLIAQDIARLVLFASSTSWLFLLFRAINWFPLVVILFILFFLVIGIIFTLNWGKLSNMDKIRLFVLGVTTGLSAAISGSDIIYTWFMSNQLLVLSISVSVLVVISLIGVLKYKSKVLRY